MLSSADEDMELSNSAVQFQSNNKTQHMNISLGTQMQCLGFAFLTYYEQHK